MTNNQTNQEPNFSSDTMRVPGGSTSSTSSPKGTSFGVVLLLLLTALVLILAGLYFWYTKMQQSVVVIPEPTRPTAAENQEPESTTAQAQADSLGVVSTSNEIEAIEADIISTNLDALDTELTAIDTEVESNTASSTPR